MVTKILTKKNKVLGVVLGCKRKYNALKVTNTALDGTVYVQTVGKAVHKREVDVYCATVERRNALDLASNEGSTLTIDNWHGETLKGYIEKDIAWKEWRDDHGVGKFTFIVDDVEEV